MTDKIISFQIPVKLFDKFLKSFPNHLYGLLLRRLKLLIFIQLLIDLRFLVPIESNRQMKIAQLSIPVFHRSELDCGKHEILDSCTKPTY